MASVIPSTIIKMSVKKFYIYHQHKVNKTKIIFHYILLDMRINIYVFFEPIFYKCSSAEIVFFVLF